MVSLFVLAVLPPEGAALEHVQLEGLVVFGVGLDQKLNSHL